MTNFDKIKSITDIKDLNEFLLHPEINKFKDFKSVQYPSFESEQNFKNLFDSGDAWSDWSATIGHKVIKTRTGPFKYKNLNVL